MYCREFAVVLGISALTSACGAAPESSGIEAVGERKDAFSAQWQFSWGVTGTSSIDLGPSNDRTCFITGIAGNLTPRGGQTVGVEVSIVESRYTLKVRSDGNPVSGYARCVNTIQNRTPEVYWAAGEPTRKISDVTGQRQCFLTGIATSKAYGMPAGFRSNTDVIRVTREGSEWKLGGTQSGDAVARARCVDINQDLGSWLWIAGWWGARKDPMAANPGDVTCFLTGIGGAFTNDLWDDGVFISDDHGQFYMNTKWSKRGFATCAR